jgi:hypothetical protein
VTSPADYGIISIGKIEKKGEVTMAIVSQSLFSWQEVSAKSDLDRLKAVIKVLPDEELMKVLEAERGKGRDDYPIRAVWNSILAGVVYQHSSIEWSFSAKLTSF